MRGIVPMLACLFVVLKLTGVIAWAWAWVLAPLWAAGVLAVLALAILMNH